ncbi:hydrolase [Arenicella chitinivorans]|uniref:Hydrolase n=1 Tax=Arenicella chitinivorans TaxID=1329800 RepID=A0A918VJ57_9GAMM|nr:HAD family phosphatase [Arenicella chitinivorans]GHA01525.1 hydrolase [Arenicella chitinivorans]
MQALIFDHDGTLVDSERHHFEVWRQILASFGVSFCETEYIREHNGVPTPQNAAALITRHNLDIDIDSLCERKNTAFAEFASRTPSPLLPTVLETLKLARKQGHKMAIATGADTRDVMRSVKAHALTPLFDAIATRSDVKHGKPAPDVYLLACERLQIRPHRAVAFEDTHTGVAAAKAAGLYCIAIPNHYSIHQDLSRADARCDTLADALTLATTRAR